MGESDQTLPSSVALFWAPESLNQLTGPHYWHRGPAGMNTPLKVPVSPRFPSAFVPHLASPRGLNRPYLQNYPTANSY